MPDLNAALAALPHGPSFRFVDELRQLDPGKSALARYTLPSEAEFLTGHFPGQPIMPGVLMIEAVAQLAGVVAQTDSEIPAMTQVRLTAVRQAKILGTIEPGQTLVLEVKIDGRMGPLVLASGSATLEGSDSPLLTAQVTLSGQVK